MAFNSTQLGAIIKETRKSLGLTQEELALVAGTGLRFIVDLEKGKPTCQIGKALLVLHTLGIKVALSHQLVDINQLEIKQSNTLKTLKTLKTPKEKLDHAPKP